MTVAKTEQLTSLKQAAGTNKPRGLWSDAWRRLKRNKMALLGAAWILFMAFIAIFAPVLAPHDPDVAAMDALPYTPPFWSDQSDPRYILGTDTAARDELSRLLYGARISMLVGFVPVTIITLLGVSIGILSGWLGGRWDNLIMRLVDVIYAFPALLFFIILQVAFRDRWLGQLLGGLVLLFGALAIFAWVDMARLVRGQVLSLKEKEFVEAARAVGTPTRRILWRHILPNSLAPIIVSIAFGVPSAILAEATLSFIGLGVQAPTASWGSMVDDSFGSIQSTPEFVLMPAILIALIMLAFTFLGDGVRDALDPQMSK